ncbi:M13-type metalloendopeptidase (plasmid) [Sphingobium sp. SJ10-10]|nr:MULTISPECIES: M13-type metalloendopeptidase [Sphingobium]MCB4859021.1 M13 family peptidase [Sphingobium sp. PNB]MEC6701544.1 M13-type metalloendopeptidase [Sphingobium sp. SJ10-10]NML91612.1 M13 family peptidase [Sphingobium sp. TB-6]
MFLAVFSFPAAHADQGAPSGSNASAYGTYGLDEDGMDHEASPGEDFSRYANGNWDARTAIPEDKASFGMINLLEDLSRERTRAILDAARKDPLNKIGAAYSSYMGRAAVEKAGLTTIAPWLREISELRDKAGLENLVAKANRIGVAGPFRLYVGQDDKKPDSYIIKLSQGGLGLPDRDYYLEQSDKMAAIRTAYRAYLTQMLTLIGETDAGSRADALMTFETAIAKLHWSRVESRDVDRVYNKTTLAKLTVDAPGFDFPAYFAANGIKPAEMIVAQPSAIAGEAALIAKTPLQVLKDALLVRSIHTYADFLPDHIGDEDFAFYGTILAGTPMRPERWKRGIDFLKGALGEEVGKAYVARYFPPETKEAMDALVQNVIAAMGRRIDKLTWMSDTAKIRARRKLAAFTAKTGYPDRWRDYSGLMIKAGDLFGNAVRANQFAFDYQVGKLGKPIYRWEWGMTPMEINAYANFGKVEIVFPAAILLPPFFDPNADPAVNYGAIGAVIGHEISHHFDDQGSKYDETGKLNPWWSEADVATFKALSGRLVDQFDRYEPFPGVHVKGAMTLGENIGDLAGLAVALDAYHTSLGGKQAPVINGKTGDQRFFLGWAQVWRIKYREAALRQRLVTDSHSPAQYRISTVRNFDEWYAAFKPEPGEKLYLPTKDRVKIW